MSEEELEKKAYEVAQSLWGIKGVSQRKFLSMVDNLLESRWNEQMEENQRTLDCSKNELKGFKDMIKVKEISVIDPKEVPEKMFDE